MRSVVRLRTRPGRPLWQLTTRPSTAAVLALVSLAAAGVQVVLFSSPTPWYQVAVVVFWAVVGLAFLASALGTRARARRRVPAPARPAVDAVPFVPVPVRPARPRRRDDPEAVAEVGEPTDPVAPTRTAARRPTPTPRPSATAEPTTTLSRPSPSPRAAAAGRPAAGATERIVSAPRPAPRWRPSPAAEERTTTVAVTSRHAVRAVALVDSVSRPVAVPAGAVAAAERRGASLTAETVAIRDGRVRPGPSATVDRSPAASPATTGSTTGRRAGGRRRLADESRATTPPRPTGSTGPAAPADAVPSPRPVSSEERPRPSADRAAAAPRPTRARRAAEPRDEGAGVRRSSHARRTAAQEREQPPRERHITPDRAPARRPDAPAAERERVEPRHAGPTRRREEPPGSTETTAPFGGGLTFGGALSTAPAPEAWAPAPREPVSGKHAAVADAAAGQAPRGAAGRHAVAAEPGRRRAS